MTTEADVQTCERCGAAFVPDTDQDHLWAFVGCVVRCAACYESDVLGGPV